jgi:ParB-like chromosome segregation protein Spo0J
MLGDTKRRSTSTVREDGDHSSSKLTITYRPIGDLKPDPANPRRHSKKQVGQIARSIATFGFNVPVLVDADDKVMAGHGRLLACRELGWSEAPTLCLDHLSPAPARAFIIADNRLSEIASWDDRLLAEQLRDLSLIGLDFSIEITGFEVGEIDLRIASLDDPPPPAADPADDLPDVAPGPAITRPGDLWLLGRHRVLCGNVLDIAALRGLMGSERAAMVFTDPPYNVPIDGHASGLGTIQHRSFAMASGEMSRPAFTVFLATSLRHLAAFCAGGALIYVCIDCATSANCSLPVVRPTPGCKISASGSRIMPGWVRSIAASTS